MPVKVTERPDADKWAIRIDDGVEQVEYEADSHEDAMEYVMQVTNHLQGWRERGADQFVRDGSTITLYPPIPLPEPIHVPICGKDHQTWGITVLGVQERYIPDPLERLVEGERMEHLFEEEDEIAVIRLVRRRSQHRTAGNVDPLHSPRRLSIYARKRTMGHSWACSVRTACPKGSGCCTPIPIAFMRSMGIWLEIPTRKPSPSQTLCAGSSTTSPAHLYQGQHGLMMDTARLPRKTCIGTTPANCWPMPSPINGWLHCVPNRTGPSCTSPQPMRCRAPAGRLRRMQKNGASTCASQRIWSTSCNRNRVQPVVRFGWIHSNDSDWPICEEKR